MNLDSSIDVLLEDDEAVELIFREIVDTVLAARSIPRDDPKMNIVMEFVLQATIYLRELLKQGFPGSTSVENLDTAITGFALAAFGLAIARKRKETNND